MNDKTLNYLAAKFNIDVATVSSLVEEINTRNSNKKFKENFKQYAGLQSEINKRVAFYEEVVSNTLRKFPSYHTLELTRLSVNNKLVAVSRGDQTYSLDSIPDDFVLAQTDLLHFAVPEQGAAHRYYRVVKISARLLWNDPVAIAVHTRAAVRKAQTAYAASQVKTAKDKRVNLKNEIARLQKDLTHWESQEETLSKAGDRVEKIRARKLERKLKKAAAKAETVAS